MHAKGRLEEMNLLLAHLGVEARVRVLEPDRLLGREQVAREVFLGSCVCGGGTTIGVGVGVGVGAGVVNLLVKDVGGEGVNVGPFAGAAAAGGGVPFLAQGGDEGLCGGGGGGAVKGVVLRWVRRRG